jgi:GntR family transcriptional regulator/MocR family aminotransferase
VELNGLSRYWLPDSTTPEDERAGLVLGFAAVPEAQIEQAVQALRLAWRL